MTTLAHPCLEVETSEAPQPAAPPGLPKQSSLLSTCDGPGAPTGGVKPSRSRPCPAPASPAGRPSAPTLTMGVHWKP
jgi:hypothetical protein